MIGPTHREQLEERILENLPLLVLVGDHGNVHFAKVLREQEDQTHRAGRREEEEQKNTEIKVNGLDEKLRSDFGLPPVHTLCELEAGGCTEQCADVI